ncbi:hypothetical protein [Caulobacter sp. LARHSG274]
MIDQDLARVDQGQIVYRAGDRVIAMGALEMAEWARLLGPRHHRRAAGAGTA